MDLSQIENAIIDQQQKCKEYKKLRERKRAQMAVKMLALQRNVSWNLSD